MKNTFSAYLLSIFFIGLGFIFITPPFEAFDENAHYSRIIESISNNFSIKQNNIQMDKRIENYEGPMPYGIGINFDDHLTYKTFFDGHYKENFIQKYKDNSFDFSYKKGEIINWQYQHPPLYYMVTGLILSPFDNLSLQSQINFLRILSFIFALIGVVISLIAVQKFLGKHNEIFGFYFYPIFFPMFFIEFARIGNDSICLLLNSIIFYYSLKWFKYKNHSSLFLIGILLGVGILVKAFFIPIFISLILFVFFIDYSSFKSKLHSFKLTTYISFPFLIFIGLWFTFNLKVNNDFGLGSEFNELMHTSLLDMLNNFSIQSFFRGALVPIITFSWSGTWSFTRMPALMQILFFLPCIYLGYFIFKNIYRQSLDQFHYLGIFLLLFFYCSLIFHVFIGQVLVGLGTSGGWYFHIFFPWIGLMLSSAINPLLSIRVARFSLYCLVSFCFIFVIFAIWFHLSLYGGCSIMNDSKYFDFPNQFFCLDKIPEVIQNNLVLNHTLFGLLCMVVGYFILLNIIKKVMFSSKNLVTSVS